MPLMQPAQNQWVNPASPFVQSQFANSAQGYQSGNTFATSQPVTAQQAPTSNQSGGSFMSPGVVNAAAKGVGKFVGNGFSLDGLLGSNAATAAPAVGQATESFLPSGFTLGANGNAFGSVVPEGFGAGPSPVADIVSSTWKDIASLQNSLGSQAFGANGFAGTLGSSGLDLVGNGIANFGAGFLGNKLGGLIGGGGPVADIGGTLGGAIGAFVGGPVGSFIGSALGSVVGGFFGGKKTPHPASAFSGGKISDVGLTSGARYGSKHLGDDVAKGIEDDFSGYLQNQSKTYGIKYAPGFQLSGGYDTGRWGGATYIISDEQGRVPDTNFNFDPNDADSTAAAKKAAFEFLATNSGIDPTKLTPVAGQAGTAGTSPGVGGNGTVTIKQGTQGSFNAFMKTYRGGTNVQTPA